MSSSQAMPCPVCSIPLVMSERQGVEIDYCPQCRGVWLDRGELDKILERTSQDMPAPIRQAPPSSQPFGHQQQSYGKQSYPKRRKSFLEELSTRSVPTLTYRRRGCPMGGPFSICLARFLRSGRAWPQRLLDRQVNPANLAATLLTRFPGMI